MKVIARSFILFFVLIIIWQLIVSLLKLPVFILPPPSLVVVSLIHHSGLIMSQAMITITEAISGLIFSFLMGTIGALLIVYFKPARLWFFPILIISQALPTFAIAPLFVIWFGYGMASKIAVTIIMLFFPITSSFYDGLIQTPKVYFDLAKTMNASKWETLRRIQIPAALPSLASGLRVACVYAPMGAIIGEWVGSSKGLGYLMLNANSRMQISLVFAILLVIVVLTLLLYFGVDKLLKYFIFWEKAH